MTLFKKLNLSKKAKNKITEIIRNPNSVDDIEDDNNADNDDAEDDNDADNDDAEDDNDANVDDAEDDNDSDFEDANNADNDDVKEDDAVVGDAKDNDSIQDMDDENDDNTVEVFNANEIKNTVDAEYTVEMENEEATVDVIIYSNCTTANDEAANSTQNSTTIDLKLTAIQTIDVEVMFTLTFYYDDFIILYFY